MQTAAQFFGLNIGFYAAIVEIYAARLQNCGL
jgi:hypothetical protein